MGMSKECKAQILRTLTGKTQNVSIASNCFIGLLTAEPSYVLVGGESVFDSHELDGAGYSRMLIGAAQTASAQVMTDADENGTSVNATTIFFPEAEEDWGTVTHFALFNSDSGGTPHLWGELTSAVTINAGYVPIFKPGSLSITLN